MYMKNVETSIYHSFGKRSFPITRADHALKNDINTIRFNERGIKTTFSVWNEFRLTIKNIFSSSAFFL